MFILRPLHSKVMSVKSHNIKNDTLPEINVQDDLSNPVTALNGHSYHQPSPLIDLRRQRRPGSAGSHCSLRDDIPEDDKSTRNTSVTQYGHCEDHLSPLTGFHRQRRPGSGESHHSTNSAVSSVDSNTSEYDSDGYSTCSETWEDTWSAVNERRVNEITLDFFYQPRTLTLLSILTIAFIYIAFLRNDGTTIASNMTAGFIGVSFLFLAIGLLVFPNGPFIRPHPFVWRLVFGVSFLYLLLIGFLLFQRYSDIMNILHYIDPSLKISEADSHTMIYTRECNWTASNIWKHFDCFVPAHVIGWVFKAVIVRHYGLLWTISIMWELTEVFFAHILPNFEECWWDTLILDLLFCNGLGIYLGMKLIQWLELRNFHWESIKNIKGTSGKIKRAVLQFTPESLTRERWLDPTSTYQRALAVFILILFFQISELNCFLIKHIFYIPSAHYLVSARLALMAMTALPSIRQYYLYVTDTTCNRLGTQVWIFLAITIAEILFSIKFGMAIIPRPAFMYMVGWVLLIAVVSIGLTGLLTMYSPLWGWRMLRNTPEKGKRLKKRQRKK